MAGELILNRDTRQVGSGVGNGTVWVPTGCRIQAWLNPTTVLTGGVLKYTVQAYSDQPFKFTFQSAADTYRIRVTPENTELEPINYIHKINVIKYLDFKWRDEVAKNALVSYAIGDDAWDFRNNFVWVGSVKDDKKLRSGWSWGPSIVTDTGIWVQRTQKERDDITLNLVSYAIHDHNKRILARIWRRRNQDEWNNSEIPNIVLNSLLDMPEGVWATYDWYNPVRMLDKLDKSVPWRESYPSDWTVIKPRWIPYTGDNGQPASKYLAQWLSIYIPIVQKRLADATKDASKKALQKMLSERIQLGTYAVSRTHVSGGANVEMLVLYYGPSTSNMLKYESLQFFDKDMNVIPYLTNPAGFITKVVGTGVGEVIDVVTKVLADILAEACGLVQSGMGSTVLSYTGENGQVVQEAANIICGKKQPPAPPVTSNLNLYLALGGVAILGIFLIGSRK